MHISILWRHSLRPFGSGVHTCLSKHSRGGFGCGWAFFGHNPVWLGRGAGCSALAIFKPETVIRWHRTGFRLYWQVEEPRPVAWAPPGSSGASGPDSPSSSSGLRSLNLPGNCRMPRCGTEIFSMSDKSEILSDAKRSPFQASLRAMPSASGTRSGKAMPKAVGLRNANEDGHAEASFGL